MIKENKVVKNRPQIKNLVDKPLSIIDWILFASLAGLCFFCFQQGDILHTGGSSFAYLNGHILDFYEYNKELVNGNNYLPSTYVLFALWNIPIRILGLVKIPTMNVSTFVLMWYKLLPTVFYIFSGYLMYKIGEVIGLGRKKSKLCAYIFLTTPIAFFSQFIFGQYDIFTVFFVLLGVYYYFKYDNFKFVLFFGIAITFKYFALLIFLPMLLLREKKYLNIIKFGFLGALPFLIEVFIYIGSKAFREGVFGFGATNYLFEASIKTLVFDIRIVIVLWIAICAWAYFKEVINKQDEVKWMIYFNSLIIFLIFGLSRWHPQWLLFGIPFLVIGTMISKKPDVFLIIDIILMVLFTVFTVNYYTNFLDQALFGLGALNNIISPHLNEGCMMKDLFVIHDLSLIFSLFSGVLLVATLFKHPKFALEDFTESLDKHWILVRTRFLVGVLFFVIPAFICFFSLLQQPVANLQMPGNKVGTIQVCGEQNIVSQVFEAKEDYISKVSIDVDTFERKNQSNLKVELVDLEKGKIIAEDNFITSKLRDDRTNKVNINCKVTKGKQYRLDFIAKNTTVGDFIGIYNTEEGTATEKIFAKINGENKNYNLFVKIYEK